MRLPQPEGRCGRRDDAANADATEETAQEGVWFRSWAPPSVERFHVGSVAGANESAPEGAPIADPAGAKNGCKRAITANAQARLAGEREAETARGMAELALQVIAVHGMQRWQIETVFQQITEVFELRHLIGSTPQATVFQASLCLVMYNGQILQRNWMS